MASSPDRRTVNVPGVGAVRIRRLPPRLIRELERRATKRRQFDAAEFKILKFRYGVADPSFTIAEVRQIFLKHGAAVELVLARIDQLSDCDVRVHVDPRLSRLHRNALRTAALIMDVGRRDEAEHRAARPRASRGKGGPSPGFPPQRLTEPSRAI
jgi:hypothetical protein